MSWKCPYCDHSQVITSDNHSIGQSYLSIGYDVPLVSRAEATRCLNETCNKSTFSVYLHYAKRSMSGFAVGDLIDHWQLTPESSAKVQPDYIPIGIREDYLEACLIKQKSPKASATLSRRCIQGMIRDFAGISKSRLIDEVRLLRSELDAGTAPRGVTSESVDAIDAIREIGNIGAHMERDINEIIDVDPDEAQILINLIEMLFDEWYVARHKRALRLASVLAVKSDKDAQKAAIAAGRTPIVASNQT